MLLIIDKPYRQYTPSPEPQEVSDPLIAEHLLTHEAGYAHLPAKATGTGYAHLPAKATGTGIAPVVADIEAGETEEHDDA